MRGIPHRLEYEAPAPFVLAYGIMALSGAVIGLLAGWFLWA